MKRLKTKLTGDQCNDFTLLLVPGVYSTLFFGYTRYKSITILTSAGYKSMH